MPKYSVCSCGVWLYCPGFILCTECAAAEKAATGILNSVFDPGFHSVLAQVEAWTTPEL